jgi:glycosyltransferase involved in cell wall biosynthesis
MACGKILIASAVGGIPTIVEDAAILIKPGSSIAIAQKINYVLTNLETLEGLQLKARKRAEEELSINVYVRFLISMIQLENE